MLDDAVIPRRAPSLLVENFASLAKRIVVLSPHLDDGILSCGGFISSVSDTTPIEIWTLFSGAPLLGPYSRLAAWLHEISQAGSGASLARTRRREDRAACEIVGASARHSRWRDAVYRRRSDGTFMYDGDVLTGTPDPQDDGLTRDLVRKMKRSLLPSDVVLAPLGVGGHVDHVIVRRAAEALDRPLVLYYPEIPYTALYPDQALAAQSGRAPRPYRISSSNMHAWIDAVSKYASQRSMLESAAGSLPEVISACADAGLSLFESRNKNA